MSWVLAAGALAGCVRYAFGGALDATAGSDAASHDAADAMPMPDAFDEAAAPDPGLSTRSPRSTRGSTT